MRRSRLAAARAGHVRKRGQPCGRQRNVGSPRGPHLMVSTSMVYGCIIDVFNTENISAECPRRSALRSCYDYVLGLCGRMKHVVGRVFCPLRCFAALPRKLALLWGWMGGRGCCSFLSLCFFAPLARNTQHYGEGWGRCCWRLQPSDSYFGFRDGTLLVCLVGLPCLAGFGAQAVAVDQVADGRPGNLAIDPKLQLYQIALGGAGEGGKLLVGFDLGVEVAAVG